VNPPEETPVWQPGQPKLLDRVRDRCRVRHLSMSMKVSAFLIHLAVDGHMAASTQNLALSALLFLYREVLEQDFGWLENVVRVKKPKRLPVVFSPEANNRCQALIAPAIGARHFSVRRRSKRVIGEHRGQGNLL